MTIRKLLGRKKPASPFVDIPKFPEIAPSIRASVKENFALELTIAPTCSYRKEDIEERARTYFWHYPFYIKPDIYFESSMSKAKGLQGLHYKRYMHVFPAILQKAGGNLSTSTLLDCGCNAGFWSIQAVQNNIKEVVAFDGSSLNIEQACLLKEVAGFSNIDYRVLDLHEMSKDALGTYDITLFLGLLYHLNKPIEVLARLREVTRGFAVIDSDIFNVQTPLCKINQDKVHEQNISNNIAFLPSPTAIVMMLKHVGFKNVWYLENKGDVPQIYLDNNRATFIAD